MTQVISSGSPLWYFKRHRSHFFLLNTTLLITSDTFIVLETLKERSFVFLCIVGEILAGKKKLAGGSESELYALEEVLVKSRTYFDCDWGTGLFSAHSLLFDNVKQSHIFFRPIGKRGYVYCSRLVVVLPIMKNMFPSIESQGCVIKL